jgi:hypothetical protein
VCYDGRTSIIKPRHTNHTQASRRTPKHQAHPLTSVKTLFLLLAALAIAPLAAPATLISGSDIIPSTTLTPTAPFSIDQITDGIGLNSDPYPWNGFVSAVTSGTITLDLVGNFDLGSFVLANDINVAAEGIAHFRLDFFDASDALITSSVTLVGPVGQVAPETYNFETVHNVSRVDLVVIDCNPYTWNQIEIREVAFGTPEVPEPSCAWLGALGILGLVRSRRCATQA